MQSPINVHKKWSSDIARDQTPGVPPKLSIVVRTSFLRHSGSKDELPNFVLPDFIKNNTIVNDCCQLCEQYHRREEMASVGSCSHLFCTACLHRYCIYKIDVMQNVSCPQQGCEVGLAVGGGVYLGLPEGSKRKYERTLLWKQTMANPNLKLCPREECTGVIDKSREVNECEKCRHRFCKECELPQHVGPCDANFQRNFKDWKRCPGCSMFIERTEGCNHMVCRCGNEFCYVCLAGWSDEHYECGNRFDDQFGEDIANMAVWKRFLLGLLMVLLYPVCLGLMLAGVALGVALGALVGLFVGPAVAFTKVECLQNIIGFMFCPVYMVVGAAGGALMAFGYGMVAVAQLSTYYFRIIRSLWCSCDQPPQVVQPQLQLI